MLTEVRPINLGKGKEVVISESPSTLSSTVKILRRYLSKASPYVLDSGHFIFRPISNSKSGHKLASLNKPISYSSVRDYFKKTFKNIVPDISLFSTHLLRAGVADRLFQRHGR